MLQGAFGGSSLNSLVKITGYNSKRLNEIADGALSRIERTGACAADARATPAAVPSAFARKRW